MTEPVASQLGVFLAGTTLDAIPEPVLHQGRRSLLNGFGCALAVPADPALQTVAAVARTFSGPPEAGLVGRGERLDAMHAAFVNAIGFNLLDFDDTHLRTVIHPTAPVAAAVLALAERRGEDGAALLRAFLLGAEVTCRLGNAVSPGHYDRGWHITATCGVLGAAAASAVLLGLAPSGCARALGIAASASAGLVENLASGAKNLGVGNAARNGVLAALLAERDLSAAPRAIEGDLGWARAMGDVPMLDEVLGGLGDRWEIARNTFKPYPCGIVLHSVIDACLELRARHALDASAIDEVAVSGDALLLARGDRAVANERDARVSIHHAAAVALMSGTAGLDEFSAERVADPATAALRGKVRAVVDGASPRGAATVTVRLENGQSFARTVAHARGSLERPLTDADLETKMRALARHGGSTVNVDALLDALWRVDRLERVTTLMTLAAPRGTRP